MPTKGWHLMNRIMPVVCSLNAHCAGAGAAKGAQSAMDTTILNYAIGAVILAGAFAVTLAILVW
jgi:hypothetical protein